MHNKLLKEKERKIFSAKKTEAPGIRRHPQNVHNLQEKVAIFE
jgi:hypothetical protein